MLFSNNFLTNVTIPSSLITIGEGPFADGVLTGITVDDQNPSYSSLGGVLFDKNQTALIQCPIGMRGHYTAPDTVTSIQGFAFYDCTSLTGITLGGNLTNIGEFVFQYCGLTTITIPDDVTNIGDDAFYLCSALTNVTIGRGVSSIWDYAFECCYNLTGVYCRGNVPSPDNDSTVFSEDNNATVYYLPGTTGWGSTFDGLPTAVWPPQVQTSNASFGMRTNEFGFTINWASGMTVVVEASTNLTNATWIPLATNTLSSDSAYFSDPRWTNYPGCFYRLAVP